MSVDKDSLIYIFYWWDSTTLKTSQLSACCSLTVHAAKARRKMAGRVIFPLLWNKVIYKNKSGELSRCKLTGAHPKWAAEIQAGLAAQRGSGN